MKKYLSLVLILIAFPFAASAQQWSIGINALDLANVGTLNAEAGVSVSQHVSLTASARVNPWTFNKGEQNQKQNRHQTYALGMRWWPWHVNSGWWVSGKAQYEQYNRGGFLRRETEEGDAWGLGAGFGYTLMLSDHVNLEFGAGLWGGYKTYTVYACPTCGRKTGEGSKWFILPNEAIISIVYVF